MPEFLVGIMFHEPKPYALWQKGVIEDYECSTACFIDATSKEEALSWGKSIGVQLLRHVNNDPTLDWQELGYFCWIEEPTENSVWSHCAEFFQHVRDGELPELVRKTTQAYSDWMAESDIVPREGVRTLRSLMKRVLRFFR